MKTLLFLLFSCISSQLLCAQMINFKWAKQLGGTSNETGNGIITDASGNVYTVGNFAGTVDFDPGPMVFNLTAATEDAFLTKFDLNGNFIWAKQFAGTQYISGLSIALDIHSNIYITGNFTGQVDFDPGLASYSLSAIGVKDIFITKLDQNGNLLWVKQMGEALSISGGTSITVDVSGNIFVTGVISNIYIFILKTDSDGNTIWEKRIGHTSSLCHGTSVSTDISGNVYTAGNFSTSSEMLPVDFDPGPGTYNLAPRGNADAFVCKLNEDGDFVWARQLGGVNLEEANAITLDAAGNAFITGYFNGNCDFDPGPAVFNLSAYGDEDIFLVKLDISGNLIWARQIGGPLSEFGNSLMTDASGNIYLTGYFYGTVDFDPGPAVYNINTQGLSDIFITKLDGDGNLRWATSIGGPLVDLSHSLYLDGSGNIYTTGYFHNTVDFDMGPGVYSLTVVGERDIFVHKMGYCTNISSATITASACSDYILNGQTYTTSGIYTQYLVNVAGCDSILKLDLSINGSLTTVNKTICQGQSYYAGGANQTTSGVYHDKFISSLGCDSVITTNLTVSPNPKPNLGPDGNLCSTSNTALISPGSFMNYLWHDNSTQPDYTVNSPGKFWVIVTDINSCIATDTITISALDTIPKNFLPADQLLCYGNVVRIAAMGNYVTYQWSTGSSGDFIDISNFDTYYLTVKDFNSCAGTDSITIKRKNCIYINIPNAFTPNSDTKNDIFKPVINQAVKDYHFIVFNRFGQKVFETREYDKGWDGTLKGKPQPPGAYVYHIKYNNIFGSETVENGSVLLIR